MIHKRIVVKLVITEISHSNEQKTIRRALSPVASIIPNVGQQYGMFHTALVIGPWYLEWTDSSLCVPRRIMSSAALISADIGEIYVAKDDLEVIANKIAAVITKWNTHKRYINFKMTGKGINEGNCQDFVEDVLKQCGIEMKIKDGAFSTW